MNRADLDIALVTASNGAIFAGAHHVTTWVSEDNHRAIVTVHFPLREERVGTDAYRLLESMGANPGTITVSSEKLTGFTRHEGAVVELVVMLGSGVKAIAAAIPQPRDGEPEYDPDDAPDRTSVLVDGTEL